MHRYICIGSNVCTYISYIYIQHTCIYVYVYTHIYIMSLRRRRGRAWRRWQGRKRPYRTYSECVNQGPSFHTTHTMHPRCIRNLSPEVYHRICAIQPGRSDQLSLSLYFFPLSVSLSLSVSLKSRTLLVHSLSLSLSLTNSLFFSLSLVFLPTQAEKGVAAMAGKDSAAVAAAAKEEVLKVCAHTRSYAKRELD